MSGIGWAYISFALITLFVASWMGLVQRVQIARGRGMLRGLAAAAMVAAVLALLGTPGTLGSVLASASLLVGAVFFVLGSLASQSKQQPAVALGRPLPAFEAVDHAGEPFRSQSLRGKPVLIKFFRGHW